MIRVKSAQLHAPIFVGGKNLSDNLRTEKNEGLVMHYDRKEQELHVTWAGETGFMPASNIKLMVAAETVKVAPVESTLKIKTEMTAQVETPQSHVFAGAGAGKTGLGSKP